MRACSSMANNGAVDFKLDPSLRMSVTGDPSNGLIELSFQRQFAIRPEKFVVPLSAVDAIMHAACTIRLMQQQQGGVVPAAPSSPVPDAGKRNPSLSRG
jgi:hypothetical protein